MSFFTFTCNLYTHLHFYPLHLQLFYLQPPPQYQQLDLPKGKLDDSHSDMSGESAGDSGKGGSDDDLQLASLSYRDGEYSFTRKWNTVEDLNKCMPYLYFYMDIKQ